MKLFFKYIFTTNPKNVVADCVAHRDLRNKLGRVKRIMDEKYEYICDTKIVNVFSHESKVLINSVMFKKFVRACRENCPGVEHDIQSCVYRVFESDGTHKYLLASTDMYSCPNFNHDKQCQNKQCWRHAENSAYIACKKTYEDTKSEYENYWTNKFKQAGNAK